MNLVFISLRMALKQNYLIELIFLPYTTDGLQDIAILMFKAKHEISPVYVKRIFESVDNGYLALRNADFPRPRFNTVQYAKHSI